MVDLRGGDARDEGQAPGATRRPREGVMGIADRLRLPHLAVRPRAEKFS